MNANRADADWPDPKHLENRRKICPEELEKYRGKQIAWSWDGTQILAAGEDLEEVFRELEAGGVDAGRVVFSYMDDV